MSQRPLKSNRSFSEVRTKPIRTRYLPRAVAGVRRVNDVAREIVVLVAYGCLTATIIVLTLSAMKLDAAIVHAIARKIDSDALSLWEWSIVVLGGVALCAALKHEATRILHDRRKRERGKRSRQAKQD